MNGIAKFASLLQTFSSVHDGFQSLQGKLLLDGGSITGSFFNRTVVLICQHSTDGAFGLVLNRGAERTVGEAITDELPERIGDQDLWVGGPVQPAALSYLHSDEFLPDANVSPNLNLDHSLEDLVELGNSFFSMHPAGNSKVAIPKFGRYWRTITRCPSLSIRQHIMESRPISL